MHDSNSESPVIAMSTDTLIRETVVFTLHLPDSRCVIQTVVTLSVFICLTVGHLACHLNGSEDETAGSRMYRITSAHFQNNDGNVLPVDLEDLFGGTDRAFLRMASAGGRACFYLVHDSCHSEMNMEERTENEFVSDEITEDSYTWMFTVNREDDSLKLYLKSRCPVMNNPSATGHFTFNVSGVEVDTLTADDEWPVKLCRLSE